MTKTKCSNYLRRQVAFVIEVHPGGGGDCEKQLCGAKNCSSVFAATKLAANLQGPQNCLAVSGSVNITISVIINNIDIILLQGHHNIVIVRLSLFAVLNVHFVVTNLHLILIGQNVATTLKLSATAADSALLTQKNIYHCPLNHVCPCIHARPS